MPVSGPLPRHARSSVAPNPKCSVRLALFPARFSVSGLSGEWLSQSTGTLRTSPRARTLLQARFIASLCALMSLAHHSDGASGLHASPVTLLRQGLRVRTRRSLREPACTRAYNIDPTGPPCRPRDGHCANMSALNEHVPRTFGVSSADVFPKHVDVSPSCLA